MKIKNIFACSVLLLAGGAILASNQNNGLQLKADDKHPITINGWTTNEDGIGGAFNDRDGLSVSYDAANNDYVVTVGADHSGVNVSVSTASNVIFKSTSDSAKLGMVSIFNENANAAFQGNKLVITQLESQAKNLWVQNELTINYNGAWTAADVAYGDKETNFIVQNKFSIANADKSNVAIKGYNIQTAYKDIHNNGNYTVGTIEVSGFNVGINALNNITVDGGKIAVSGANYAIGQSNNVSVSNNGELNVNAAADAVSVSNNFTLGSGFAKISAAGTGIKSLAGTLSVTDGHLEIESGYWGVETSGNSASVNVASGRASFTKTGDKGFAAIYFNYQYNDNTFVVGPSAVVGFSHYACGLYNGGNKGAGDCQNVKGKIYISNDNGDAGDWCRKTEWSVESVEEDVFNSTVKESADILANDWKALRVEGSWCYLLEDANRAKAEAIFARYNNLSHSEQSAIGEITDADENFTVLESINRAYSKLHNGASINGAVDGNNVRLNKNASMVIIVTSIAVSLVAFGFFFIRKRKTSR